AASLGPYHPTARPRKPPTSAPAMPNRMVTIHPPGSRPGMRSLATAPTINPKMIHPMIPMRISFLRAPLAVRPEQAQQAWRAPQQAGQAGLLCLGMFVIHQQGSCKFPPASSLFPYFVEQTGVFRAPESSLADDLVRQHQEARGYRNPECLGGLEVHDQLELVGLLHGQVSWLGALEPTFKGV